MKKEINVSVHTIVDFVFAKGDIIPNFVLKNNLKDGTTVHLTVQKQHTLDETEVFVKLEDEIDEYKIKVQGRIDILENNNGKYHVIEIKSTDSLENLTEETNLAHFAQAKLYGLMLFNTLNISNDKQIDISVLYVNKYNYKKKYITNTYTYKQLKQFYQEVLRKYLSFIKLINDFKEKKLNSIKELYFPFENYRLGQIELMNQVTKMIDEGGNLYVCAPTGIGKSLGTIYPAIKSINKQANQIFYLTAKSMVKDVARNAVNILRNDSNLKFKSLSITAKEKICINDVCKCNPKDCKYAKGFYNKLNDAIVDIFNSEDDYYYDNILIYAKKHQICPFEYQLELSLYVDMVICDYNYVFDPRVYLRRFFDIDTQNIILLIDEAHNMYDRVCNMYTISINFEILKSILGNVNKDKNITKSCNSIINKLIQYQNLLASTNNQKFEDLDYVLLDDISILLNHLEKYFEKLRSNDIEVSDELLESYFQISNFSKISEFYSSDFIVWVENKYEEFNYQISCLNPKELVKIRTNQVKSSIFFSATLHPIDYYISLLGGDESSTSIVLESPFNQKNLSLFIKNNISTKYNYREYTKDQIASLIAKVIKNGGKYLIYFPSYKYLDMVYTSFIEINNPSTNIVKQERYMNETDKVEFINSFDESSNNIVGFAVLGGIFAEGIDLKGEKLNGVVVVGVGLPQFDSFRNELRSYFDKEYKRGYQYAYMYPGFNKILQAVGRVIRSEDDKGLALLIDERYLYQEYMKLFPKHWSHYRKI